MSEAENRPDSHPSSPYASIEEMEEGEIVHMATGVNLNFNQLIDQIVGQKIIYVGENHDNIEAHEVQLSLIEELHRRREGRIAIGMEMFRCDVQDQLDKLVTGELSMDDFNQLFDEQWTAKWRPAYQKILNYIHQNKLYLVGLKPTRQTEDVVREGGTDAATPELDLEDIHHQSHYMPFFQGGKKPQNASRVYRIMCLWDEAMAQEVARFIANPKWADTQMIAIAGNGHFNYGFGIPKRTFRRQPHIFSTILPLHEHDTEKAASLQIADYVWKVIYDQLPEIDEASV